MRPIPEPGTPSVTALRPSSSRRQKSGMLGAPGNRQAMPTIAIGGASPEISGFRTSDRATGPPEESQELFDSVIEMSLNQRP